MQHTIVSVQRMMEDASNNIVFFIIGMYIQSSGQNTFSKITSLGRSRCRWEDNIKIGEHSSLLRCSSLLTGGVTEVKGRSTFTFRHK